MRFDEDIKIAGEHPSADIKKTENTAPQVLSKEKLQYAKTIGRLAAEKFLQDTEFGSEEDFNNADMLLQRRILLSFATRIAFENYLSDDALGDIAKNSFSDRLKAAGEEYYSSSTDMGAFSFYYLAYRRGDDTERRIGQTFAMLCSHDGDPIFQELGEALYCWFLSAVKKIITETQI